MNRRPKNQHQSFNNPPGNSWQVPGRNDVNQPFWGKNNPNIKQKKVTNDQPSRPGLGDRAKNNWKGSTGNLPPQLNQYQWSTEKDKTTSKNMEDEASTSLQNETASSTNKNEDPSFFASDKSIRREQNRQLAAGLSKPVECSIAERMMQKMGWQGGGLGVKEEGRTEPININLNFINKTTGLGHDKKQKVQSQAKLPKQSKALHKMLPYLKLPIKPVLYLQPVTLDFNHKQPDEKKERKLNKKEKKKALNRMQKHFESDIIDIEILDNILDFVMDVKQIEYGFDKVYNKRERRVIHNFIEYLREGVHDEIDEVVFYLDQALMDKIEEIKAYNNYVLMTESQGVHRDRQLFMFKEAPDEVYLVTKDDLIEKENEEPDSDTNNDVINIENTAKEITKTPDDIKDVKDKDVKNDLNIDLKQDSSKTEVDNDLNIDLKQEPSTKVDKNDVHMIISDLVDSIPKKVQKIDTDIKKSVDCDAKDKNMKQKASVADFIRTCSEDHSNDEEKITLTSNNIERDDLITNISNKSNTDETETETVNNFDIKLKNSKDAIDMKDIDTKQKDIIEIDLTDSDDNQCTEPISLKTPEIHQPNKDSTTEIKDDENDTENDMDIELQKLHGLPKPDYFEKALYIYLKDFKKHDVYTEMRFLGDFDDEETELLNKLLSSICEGTDGSKKIVNDSSLVVSKEVNGNDTYYLRFGTDCNGGSVIYKELRKAFHDD